MRTIICPHCGGKNKIGGMLKGRTCKLCGMSLETRPVKSESNKKPQIVEKVVERVVVQTQTGEFKQHGVLCLKCKYVTPFGNKRCQNCKNKLKVNALTIIYYNGLIEAVQCPKCGNYTDYKKIICTHCNKKLKVLSK